MHDAVKVKFIGGRHDGRKEEWLLEEIDEEICKDGALYELKDVWTKGSERFAEYTFVVPLKENE